MKQCEPCVRVATSREARADGRVTRHVTTNYRINYRKRNRDALRLQYIYYY